ncbi:MAG: AraC family transcriptional regulator ligand-binding domain-containing protein [Myxococcales bacterium]|nr:AraC family transcriptional regulator ligand-binding domain-containing protein [Myxococcales bacterium]
MDTSSLSFPASHILQLATLLRRWDVPAGELLMGSGLTEEDLVRAHARVNTATLVALSERARRLSGEPALGIYLGLQRRASMYGYLGFAIDSASTVREVLELTIRYSQTVTQALSFELHERDGQAWLAINEYVDLGSSHDIALFSLLLGMQSLMVQRSGGQQPADAFRQAGYKIDMPIPKPAYFDRFAHMMPETRFKQPLTRVHFNASLLEHKLRAPNPAAVSLAKEACERELERLSESSRLPSRVQRMAVSEKGLLTLAEVAQELHISVRTLKRRLSELGLRYSELVEKQRHQQALDLLAYSDHSIDEIADRLCYANGANFSRAFRRWTGESPAHYRRRSRTGD